MIIFSVDEISKIKEMCGDQADEIILHARNTARHLLRTYSEVQVECETVRGNNIEGRSLANNCTSLGFRRISDKCAKLVICIVTGD